MKRLRASAVILDAIDEVRQLKMAGQPDMRVTVCFKGRSGEIFGHIQFPTYEHVMLLAGRLRQLGYGMSILHPDTTGCDFIFEDLTQPASA